MAAADIVAEVAVRRSVGTAERRRRRTASERGSPHAETAASIEADAPRQSERTGAACECNGAAPAWGETVGLRVLLRGIGDGQRRGGQWWGAGRIGGRCRAGGGRRMAGYRASSAVRRAGAGSGRAGAAASPAGTAGTTAAAAGSARRRAGTPRPAAEATATAATRTAAPRERSASATAQESGPALRDRPATAAWGADGGRITMGGRGTGQGWAWGRALERAEGTAWRRTGRGRRCDGRKDGEFEAGREGEGREEPLLLPPSPLCWRTAHRAMPMGTRPATATATRGERRAPHRCGSAPPPRRTARAARKPSPTLRGQRPALSGADVADLVSWHLCDGAALCAYAMSLGNFSERAWMQQQRRQCVQRSQLRVHVSTIKRPVAYTRSARARSGEGMRDARCSESRDERETGERRAALLIGLRRSQQQGQR